MVLLQDFDSFVVIFTDTPAAGNRTMVLTAISAKEVSFNCTLVKIRPIRGAAGLLAYAGDKSMHDQHHHLASPRDGEQSPQL